MNTPGPWQAHGLSVTTSVPIPHHTMPRSPAPRYIARVHWTDAPEWDDHRGEADDMNMASDYGQAQANARLIAAAPDLLATLRWLADCVSEALESPEAMDYARPDLVHGLEEARAVIQRIHR